MALTPRGCAISVTGMRLRNVTRVPIYESGKCKNSKLFNREEFESGEK
jgi:hypothetical protein